MKTAANILLVLAVAALFLLGIWIGRRTTEPDIIERVVVDTVFFERPQPVGISDRFVAVNVPRVLFAPADTVMVQTNQVTNQDGGYDSVVKDYLNVDSVRMLVPQRTVEYRDSTYYARVVGPVVGPLMPRLDYIETYGRTVVRTVTKRNRFAVTAGVGAAWTPQGFQPTAGVQVGVVLWGF